MGRTVPSWDRSTIFPATVKFLSEEKEVEKVIEIILVSFFPPEFQLLKFKNDIK
jgi:hypothetical protein